MRMWGVEPEELCDKHLLGEHVEMHMFAGTIKKGCSIAGYLKNNLVSPSEIVSRHDQLAREMGNRGMLHRSPLELDICILPAEQQTHFIDKKRSCADLLSRCEKCSKKIIERGKKGEMPEMSRTAVGG